MENNVVSYPFHVDPEMIRLRSELDRRGIEWFDRSSTDKYWICRTLFYHNHYSWSVIHGYGTYGGISIFSGIDHGLLELYTDEISPEPIGSLTAKDIFEYLDGK